MVSDKTIKKSQTQWVMQKLRNHGQISRNQCLRSYISRLSAIIWVLRDAGWEFDTRYKEVKTPFGKGRDYIYKMVREGREPKSCGKM